MLYTFISYLLKPVQKVYRVGNGIFPFYIWENYSSERPSDLPEVPLLYMELGFKLTLPDSRVYVLKYSTASCLKAKNFMLKYYATQIFS